MIPETEPVKIHYGNNSATEFDFDFFIEDETQLKVTHTDLNGISNVLQYGVDYTIHEIGNEIGSYIIFPIQGSKYDILAWNQSTDEKEMLVNELVLPFSQESEYEMSRDLDKKNLEKSLDKLTRIAQILKRRVGRAVSVPEGSNNTPAELIESINQAQITAKSFAQVAQQEANAAKNSAQNAQENAQIAANEVEKILNSDFQGYDNEKSYPSGQWVIGVVEGKKGIFESLVDNNQNNPLTDETKWKKVNLGGGSKELFEIYIDPFIDESKNTGRILNGQVIIQEQFQSAVNKLKKCVGWDSETQNASLMPNIICTEDEWQTLKTMSVIGQVSKFVIDDEAGTLRLPAIKSIQGVYSLQKAGVVINQSLPNLKWGINSNSTAGEFGFFGEWHDAVTTSGGINAEAITTNMAIAEVYSAGGKRLFKLDYNANKADSTYQDNAPVQQEACGYPYCICLNPEVEETDKPINEYEIINSNTLLESKYTPLILDNLSFLRSTGQRSDGNRYIAVWNKLIESYNTNSKIGIADVKLITDDTATDYDFKIDLDTNEFILPLLDGSEKLLSDRREILELQETPYTAPANGRYFANAIGTNNSGNIYLRNETKNYASQNNTKNEAGNIYIDAQRGDKISFAYHDVTSPAIRFTYFTGNGNLYYYVGDTAQNPQIVNVARMEEKLIDFEKYFTFTKKHQLIHSDYPIPANITNFGTAYTFDLSTYLPDDGNNYMVLCSSEAQATGGDSTAFCNVYVSSDILGTDISSTTSSNPPMILGKAKGLTGGCGFVPVGLRRTITFHFNMSKAGTSWIHLFGYKKVATN